MTGVALSAPTLALLGSHLMAWNTGRPVAVDVDRPATVLLEDAAHLPIVLSSGLAEGAAVVLSPSAEGIDDPRVVGYEGMPAEPGGELAVGDDFFLQYQGYASAPFMALLGPTVVSVNDAEDFALFLADADRARDTGVFPEFMLAGPVRLADLSGLGAGPVGDGLPLRRWVSADGAVSTAPGGMPLGELGADLNEYRRRWEEINAASAAPCAVCLGRVVPEGLRAGELSARPWLATYLGAIEALRILTANGIGDVRVSGFGVRINPDLPVEAGDLRAEVAAPLVLWSDANGYLFEPVSARFFVLGAGAARATEALLLAKALPGAAEAVKAEHLASVRAFLTSSGVRLNAAQPVTGGKEQGNDAR